MINSFSSQILFQALLFFKFNLFIICEDVNNNDRTDCNVFQCDFFGAVLVAESVVKNAHPYLGSDVTVRLWSPFDDVEDLKASHSATASSDTPDSVVCCVKKQTDPVQPTEPLPDSCRSDEDKSSYDLGKKSSVANPQSQTSVPTVPSRINPRLVASPLISDVDNSHSKCLQITADSEVQFFLLKQLLDNGFAREHKCLFADDERNWTITLSSKNEECITVLAEQVYGYKKNDTFKVEVSLSPGLAQVLYDKNRKWLYDRLRRKVNEPAMMIMSTNNRLAVVAFSQNTARDGAKKLRACLLRGKVPLTDQQHKQVTSAKFRKKLNKIMMKRAIDVQTGAHEITVDGLPNDVVCAVTEIDQRLYKSVYTRV